MDNRDYRSGLNSLSIVDLTPFILMVGASITYMAIMVITNTKLNAPANEVKAVLEEEAKKID